MNEALNLDGLDRNGLKAVIKEKELNVIVVKDMTDDDIRAAIRRAMSQERGGPAGSPISAGGRVTPSVLGTSAPAQGSGRLSPTIAKELTPDTLRSVLALPEQKQVEFESRYLAKRRTVEVARKAAYMGYSLLYLNQPRQWLIFTLTCGGLLTWYFAEIREVEQRVATCNQEIAATIMRTLGGTT